MTAVHTPVAETKLIVRGVHGGLDYTAMASIESKAEKLFRREPRILRVRIDITPDIRRHTVRFTAKGRVELPGPDFDTSVRPDAAPASIPLGIGKPDRMVRKHACNTARRRPSGETRAQATPILSA